MREHLEYAADAVVALGEFAPGDQFRNELTNEQLIVQSVAIGIVRFEAEQFQEDRQGTSRSSSCGRKMN